MSEDRKIVNQIERSGHLAVPKRHQSVVQSSRYQIQTAKRTLHVGARQAIHKINQALGEEQLSPEVQSVTQMTKVLQAMPEPSSPAVEPSLIATADPQTFKNHMPAATQDFAAHLAKAEGQEAKTKPLQSVAKQTDKLDLKSAETHEMPEFLAASTTPQPAPTKPEKLLAKKEIAEGRRAVKKSAKEQEHVKTLAETLQEESHSPKRFHKLRFVAAAVIVLAGGFLIFDTVKTNFDFKAYMQAPREATVDDTLAGVSEEPISDQDHTEHVVARDEPRYLVIDSLGVDARVMKTGQDEYGRVANPANIFDANWYQNSAHPGGNGAVVLTGFINGPSQAGAFTKIAHLKSGDMLTIERGDGSKINYTVAKIATLRLADVQMEDLLKTYDDADQGLNLILSSGQWNNAGATNSDRTLVYAVRKIGDQTQ
jgi:hypothetical protein